MMIDDPATHAVFYCLQTNTWCCPTGSIDVSQIVNTTCCSRPDLVFSAPDPVIYTVAQVDIVATATQSDVRIAATRMASAVITGGVTQAAQSSTSLGFATSASSAPAQAESSSSNNKIGVYVGVPLGILLAIALGVIACLVLRNRNLKKRETGHPYHNEVNAVVNNKQMGYTHSHVNELGTRPEELPNGDYLRAELGSGK
jgi:hypothetical protein